MYNLSQYQSGWDQLSQFIDSASEVNQVYNQKATLFNAGYNFPELTRTDYEILLLKVSGRFPSVPDYEFAYILEPIEHRDSSIGKWIFFGISGALVLYFLFIKKKS
jgi:hypothetical protein